MKKSLASLILCAAFAGCGQQKDSVYQPMSRTNEEICVQRQIFGRENEVKEICEASKREPISEWEQGYIENFYKQSREEQKEEIEGFRFLFPQFAPYLKSRSKKTVRIMFRLNMILYAIPTSGRI